MRIKNCFHFLSAPELSSWARRHGILKTRKKQQDSNRLQQTNATAMPSMYVPHASNTRRIPCTPSAAARNPNSPCPGPIPQPQRRSAKPDTTRIHHNQKTNQNLRQKTNQISKPHRTVPHRTARTIPHPSAGCHRIPRTERAHIGQPTDIQSRCHRVRASLSDPPDTPKEPMPTDRNAQTEPRKRRRGNQQRKTTPGSLGITSRSHITNPNDRD